MDPRKIFHGKNFKTIKYNFMSNRPSWHILYMSMAIDLTGRSLDPRTKHGCVIVDENNKVISLGFNSPPFGCNDEQIPLEAPEKYKYFSHAEENAILNAHSIDRLKNSTFYITGMPCSACFRRIRTVKAKKIIYGPITAAMIENDLISEQNAIHLMNQKSDLFSSEYVEIVKFEDLVSNGDINESIEKINQFKQDNIKYIKDRIPK